MADELDGPVPSVEGTSGKVGRRTWRDAALWSFIAAMVLFHSANAPGGVYLGLFLSRDLHAPTKQLAIAFVVSMIAWMLVVRPAGTLADRWGRRPLLIAAWAAMALRLAIVAVARNAGEVVANQALDGLSNGLFAVLAAAWVTDRLGGARRAGEAQAIVGTSLVFGSALGPYLSALLGREPGISRALRHPGGCGGRRDPAGRLRRPRDSRRAARPNRWNRPGRGCPSWRRRRWLRATPPECKADSAMGVDYHSARIIFVSECVFQILTRR